MSLKRSAISMFCVAVAVTALNVNAADGPANNGAASSRDANSNSTNSAPANGVPAAEGAVVLSRPAPSPDPCFLAELTANPTRPNWDTAASTTQCGVIEVDSGWMMQPMGGGVRQNMLATSMRYGLTPKLDLRWGLTNHINQGGGGTAALEGVGDQWLMARYRFIEQSAKLPAMAFLYGAKIPMANPAKGFGSGFVDHQFAFIASRDLGKNHFDFNSVGTLVGGANGHDGSAQFGLALTRPVTPKFSAILESYGGPQPGTTDRFGAGLAGGAFTVRPTLVIDGAYTRTYTAGSPRQQFLLGLTYAIRPGFAPLPSGSLVGRLLGR